MREQVVMCWSGGKDSARTLHELLRDPRIEVVALLTTLTREFDRVSMHGVRRELAERQARELGLPLVFAPIPAPCTNAEYEAAMAAALEPLRAAGASAVAFGDIFLEDLRRYREAQMAALGLAARFPLFGRSTRELAEEFVALGFRARITCLDPRVLPVEFAGRELDRRCFDELPPNVDPCGENGEYHSFVFASPDFRAPFEVRVGETLERGGFVFTDLLPA
jgi:uncharacterized protein (TIGR00290 family)